MSVPVRVGPDRVLLGRECEARPSMVRTWVRKRSVGADAANWGMPVLVRNASDAARLSLTVRTTLGRVLLGRECEARPYVVHGNDRWNETPVCDVGAHVHVKLGASCVKC